MTLHWPAPTIRAHSAALLLLAACEGETLAPEPTTSPATDAAADAQDADIEAPTYHADVAPLLARHCTGCHTRGGVAPFALESYAEAAPLAGAIAAATLSRTMPPFLANASGDCNTYRDARWLSDAEIATFGAWSVGGAPEGPVTEPPARVPGAVLQGDVRSFDIGFDYVPRTDVPDDYRCFLVGSPASEDRYYVTGFDVRPGNPQVAHHAIVFHPRNEDEVAAARALDAADPGPGYACFGTSGVQAAAVAAWAPGGGATHFPSGTGVELRGGRALIVQMHYHAHEAEPAPDRSRVQLQIALEGVTAGRFLPLADLALTLEPHRAEAVWETTLRAADYTPITTPFRVRGAFPHMHTLGRSLRIEVTRDGGERECLMDVPRWDFNWQGLYFYEGEGINVRPDEPFTIRCTYDTRSRDETVRWGEGTDDEMCVAGLFITL